MLAGSFTGFLVRRHGRAAYRRLYRGVSAGPFEPVFEDSVGVTLGAAERAWRQEVRAAGPLGGLATVAGSPPAAGSFAAPTADRQSETADVGSAIGPAS